MNFGQALESLKSGKRVARAGWNGKGMWLLFVSAESWGMSVEPYTNTAGVFHRLPWLAMKTADDGLVPWLASQTDILAEDWSEV